MIIQILSNLIDEGYLNKEKSLVSPFFGGANVAFRRKVFEQIGLYDENCAACEDQDITLRAANTGWELYFEPRAVVGHKYRHSIKGFIRQWYRYGLHLPYIFKKHSSKSFTIYVKTRGFKKRILYQAVLHNEGSPILTVIFLNLFLVMNLLLAITIFFALVIGSGAPSIILAVITFVMAIFYFWSDLELKHPSRTIKLIFLRYMANLALFIGGLRGGARSRMIQINPTLDYKTTTRIRSQKV